MKQILQTARQMAKEKRYILASPVWLFQPSHAPEKHDKLDITAITRARCRVEQSSRQSTTTNDKEYYLL
jgi:hypothetical protein